MRQPKVKMVAALVLLGRQHVSCVATLDAGDKMIELVEGNRLKVK